ncbi:hypothetical protein SAMN06297387_12349 [Streptomyces zhaozhouensis]|jgi:hypothetical protein|uniref:Uncharacterized protein n=1 Tax=Streptomyces zhaozhouensis TaxID=1300267 RepID=A0A286E4E6_9ACTN|nr:hypothetical protein [Streptomyces zhaozhouensis]SOD65787.1 hypothetical protein SAMN06297387_12349 [Streptomyces zhaozhouensis]
MTVTTTLRRTLLASGVAVAGAALLFSPTAHAGEVETLGGMDLIEVAPYEAVEINAENVMGLLPEGKQNYVVSDPAAFDEAVESARELVGDDIRPNSISAGVSSVDGQVELITGAWRLDEGVPHIEIVAEGADFGYYAQPVALEDVDGWGTYYFDPVAAGVEGDAFTITASDADGDVIDEIEIATGF